MDNPNGVNREKRVGYFLLSLFIGALVLVLLIFNANRILKYELQRAFGGRVGAETLKLRWNSVEAQRLHISRPDGSSSLEADRVLIRGSILGMITGNRTISSALLESPRILVEIDRNGKMVPFLTAQGKGTDKEKNHGKPLFISSVHIRNGTLDYLDRNVSAPPLLVPLRNIELKLTTLPVPLENVRSEFTATASVPVRTSRAHVTGQGTINLKTGDSRSRLKIADLDLTLLKPYFHKKGDVDVSGGRLSMDADIRVASSRLHAAGKIVIRNLDFSPGTGNRIFGLPLLAVMNFLQDSNNEIALDFTLEGDLNNPRFSIRDSLIQKVTLSLARLLGLPIEAIGKSVLDIGRDALEKIFR